MLVYALVAHKMTPLVDYVAHGYTDAKGAASELHGRAAYSHQVMHTHTHTHTHTNKHIFEIAFARKGHGLTDMLILY